MDEHEQMMDWNRFRTLVPIGSLFEDGIRHIQRHARFHRLSKGASLADLPIDHRLVYYLISGVVGSRPLIGKGAEIEACSEAARHPLRIDELVDRRARVRSEHCVIMTVNRNELEQILVLDQLAEDDAETGETIRFNGHDLQDSEWMMGLLGTGVFRQLPAASIQQIFQRMRQRPVQAGETIVTQDAPGTRFYALREGRARVSRRINGKDVVLAQLAPPDSFGEESLLTGANRNATVTMLSDGILMTLEREDFKTLLQQPLLRWVDADEASELVRGHAIRLDVRSEAEYNFATLGSAINIPYYLLRVKGQQLRRDRDYLVFCDNGTRSAVGAYILNQLGYRTWVLRGGLNALKKRDPKAAPSEPQPTYSTLLHSHSSSR